MSSEIVAALNELLEAERAGAETLSALKAQYADLGPSLEKIEKDETWFCAGLHRCILALGGAPSAGSGDFAAKVLSLPTFVDRLQLLARGHQWVIKRIDSLLDKAPSPDVVSLLQEMREAHRRNGSWCQGQAETMRRAYPVPLFREIRVLEGLQVRSEEKDWLERPPARPRSTRTVLYLGCNILRTPHMAQTVTAIFRRLGEDFVALGGAAFCCGAPYERKEGVEAARHHGEKLTSRFQQFRPQQVVMWCPHCLHFYRHVLSLEGSFRLLHVSEFLEERMGRFTFAVQPSSKVALHYHRGAPDLERHAAAARALLAAIPGVELLDIGSSDAFGLNCTGFLRERLGREAWEALIKPFFHQAALLGADSFATLYHGCYRMYAGYQKDSPFVIEHYLTVVARALGITYPEKYKQYLLWRNSARILEDGHPCLEANLIPLEQATATVDLVFAKDCGL